MGQRIAVKGLETLDSVRVLKYLGMVHHTIPGGYLETTVHVDDPLVIGPEGPIRNLFEWLGQRIAVKGLETLDSVRVLKYLGMVYHTVPGGYLETTPSGYIEGLASRMGVTHATTPSTPGIRPRQPTEAEEKPMMRQDTECFAPLWARHNGFSELDLTCCVQSRSSAEGCRDLVRSTTWQPRGW